MRCRIWQNQGKKAINIVSKLGLGITIGLMAISVTTAAIIGAVSGIAISAIIALHFPNLLPMIAGEIIGLGILPLYWTILTGTLVVLLSPIQFGIGVGLTALGLTSPAAIGALSAGLIAAIPFLFVLAGIDIWSGMMSSFMGLAEEKSPNQVVSLMKEWRLRILYQILYLIEEQVLKILIFVINTTLVLLD